MMKSIRRLLARNLKISDLAALLAFAGLLIYGLACVYPVAWSPDSKKAVFPIFSKEVIRGLLIADIDGKIMRRIAGEDTGEKAFSPAAWSSDGKWIAYLKFTPEKPEKDGAEKIPAAGSKKEKINVSLMLYDVETKSAMSIFEFPATGDLEKPMQYPPQWTEDSGKILVVSDGETASSCTLVDLQGKTLWSRTFPTLSDEKGIPSSSMSPDGKHFAWVERCAEVHEKASVHLLDIGAGSEPESIGKINLHSQKDNDIAARIVWSNDSKKIYVADYDEEKGILKCFGTEKREWSTVFKEEKATLAGVGVATGSSRIVIDCIYKKEERQGGCKIAVLDLKDNSVYKTFPTAPFHYSTSLSPDGKWIAFCAMGKNETGSKGSDEYFMGCFLSVEDGELRFLEQHLSNKEVDAANLRRNELGVAFSLSGAASRLEELKPGKWENPVLAEIGLCIKEIDAFNVGYKGDVYKEALAYFKVDFCLDGLGRSTADEKAAVAEESEKRLGEFRKAYPKHPCLADLDKRFMALKNPSEKAKAAENQPATNMQ